MNENKFFLCGLSGKELSILIGILSAAISEGLSADELNVLGNFITALGSSLLTVAAAEQGCNSKTDKNTENDKGKIKAK